MLTGIVDDLFSESLLGRDGEETLSPSPSLVHSRRPDVGSICFTKRGVQENTWQLRGQTWNR
jgi:hypothetical protein